MFSSIKSFNLKPIRFFSFLIITCLSAVGIAAQNLSPAKPLRQETLLNGLRTAIFPGKDGKVYLKLRINAGAAFDLQGKEGTMAILAGTFFPNPGAADFFREDLGGSLEISTTYDFIQITASSRPEEFLTLIESIANAVANPTIDKPTVETLKKAQIERIANLEKNPSYVGEQYALARLFGNFPYGRPVSGSIKSVEKLEFADIIDARQRFLTADKASLAISGSVDANLALRAVRRYFGAWTKADRQIPVTFRQPDAPSAEVQTIDGDVSGFWMALRGVARGNADHAAAEILSVILAGRISKNLPSGTKPPVVFNRAFILPGAIVIGIPDGNSADDRELIRSLLSNPISQAELDQAKTLAASGFQTIGNDDIWLDSSTYNFKGLVNPAASIAAVSLSEVSSLASRLAAERIAAVRFVKNPKTSEVK